MQPVLEFLEQHVYRPKRAWYVFGMVLAVAAALACVGWGIVQLVSDETSSLHCHRSSPTYAECVRRAGEINEKQARFFFFCALPPLVFAGMLLSLYWPYKNWQSLPLVRMLRDRPHEVVWLYVERVRVRRVGVTHVRVVFGAADKRRHRVQMNNMDEQRALPLFAAALPHATVGYDLEKNARFMRDPMSLRKGAAPGAAAAPAPAPAQGALRMLVAPQIPFGHLDQALRSLGLAAEPPAAPVAPGEPGAAAWSASWARIVYRFDPTSRTRSLELYAQDSASLRARVAATGLPISG